MKTLVAAIEFGTSKIVTVIARSSSRNDFDIISCSNVDYAGYRDGDWINREELETAIYNSIVSAQSEAGFQISEIYIGVPSEFMHVYTAEATVKVNGEGGRVSVQDIENLEDMAADKFAFHNSGDLVIHRSPCWYSVDKINHEIAIEGRKGEYLHGCISFITAVDYFVKDMREIMGQVGITINGFLSSTFAEILSGTDNEDRDRGCILIDSGMLNTEFCAVKGDAICYHAVLPFGGYDITQAIADDFGISYDEAEALKREATISPFGEDDKQAETDEERVDEICKEKLTELCEYLKRTEEEVTGVLVPRSCIYLNGGGIALLRGGIQFVEDYTDRNVKTRHVKSSKIGGPEYAAAIGLVDLIFDSIDRKPEKKNGYDDDQALPVKAFAGLRGLFKR